MNFGHWQGCLLSGESPAHTLRMGTCLTLAEAPHSSFLEVAEQSEHLRQTRILYAVRELCVLLALDCEGARHQCLSPGHLQGGPGGLEFLDSRYLSETCSVSKITLTYSAPTFT